MSEAILVTLKNRASLEASTDTYFFASPAFTANPVSPVISLRGTERVLLQAIALGTSQPPCHTLPSTEGECMSVWGPKSKRKKPSISVPSSTGVSKVMFVEIHRSMRALSMNLLQNRNSDLNPSHILSLLCTGLTLQSLSPSCSSLPPLPESPPPTT